MWLCSEHQKLPRVTVLEEADPVDSSEAETEHAESVLMEELQQLQRAEKQLQKSEDQQSVPEDRPSVPEDRPSVLVCRPGGPMELCKY